MNDHVREVLKIYNWLEEKPHSGFKYAIERLEYFQEELFKYAKFKVGDEVEIGKDMNLSQETSPGYWAYRARLAVGCCGKIVEVDHYKGKFRYSVTMEPIDDGYFTIREETLKPKGWDGQENEK